MSCDFGARAATRQGSICSPWICGKREILPALGLEPCPLGRRAQLVGIQFLDGMKANYINEFRPQCESFPAIEPRCVTGVGGR
jgi:hypothetical protein